MTKQSKPRPDARLQMVPNVRQYMVLKGVLGLSRRSRFAVQSINGFNSAECRKLLRQNSDELPAIPITTAARASSAKINQPVILSIYKRAIARAPARVADQAYDILITQSAIDISAADLPGLRYAIVTLKRLLQIHPRGLPAARIIDWPDFSVRGVMLDISRDKVPAMATLRKLISMFASWKLNELQLYMEHAFAYRGHEVVWKNASPMTPAQVRSLDKLCRSLGIELVPNQNSLGHMERWLKHPRYAPLADYDGPYKTPWGETRTKPTTLNPVDPRSVKLVASLYDQLLPNFSSRKLNVGCDEPFELGQGKSLRACRKRGAGRVYFDYLMKVYREVKRRGHRMQFWSDWIQRDPELIDRLPRDVIPLVWGYEADHPFDEECRRPARLGLDFYVCPGTSSWCSFAGRTANMLSNMRNAANAGIRHGATGYLITDWGDFGHRQHLPVSYAGFMYGAAVAWCGRSNSNLDIAAALSSEVFADRTGRLARAWLAAGRVHEASGILQKNRTVLFACMQGSFADPAITFGVTPRGVERMLTKIKVARRLADTAKPECKEATLLLNELNATLDILEHACHRMRYIHQPRSGQFTAKLRTNLADEMQRIVVAHRKLWTTRNRSGGLRDSLSHYLKCLREYKSTVP